MSQLFTPLRLRGTTFKNRIVMAPMCQYSTHGDGLPTDWHLAHYGARAALGAGMIILEATAVAAIGRITPYDLGLWTDRQAEALNPVAAFIREQGAIPAVQIAHAGRKASTGKPWEGGGAFVTPQAGGWQPVAPSPIAFSPESPAPTELSVDAIEEIVQQFAAAAKRAHAAGFEAVQIHMAHGYLLHEFLSPLTNHRTDEFGGSFANRARLPLEAARAVRAAWPDDKPVMVRLSVTDWVEGGWDIQGSIDLVRELKAIGIDLVDVSSGGLIHGAKVPAAPGFHAPLAETLRRETSMPVSVVGLITDPHQAETILSTGQADAVCLARELLRNPAWPLVAAQALGDDIHWPPQYARAKG